MKKRIAVLGLLLAAFALLAFGASLHDISPTEARLMWAVRDPEPLAPASIADTGRLVVRNFRAMINRADIGQLPLALPLDVWSLAVGQSIFAARMGGVLALLLATMLALRLVPRAALALGVILLAGGLFSVLTARAPLAHLLQTYQAARTPDIPVLTDFAPDSPAGYHQASVDLRRGIAVDVGWRDFDAAEYAQIAANLGQLDVWLISDLTRGQSAAIEAALIATGRRPLWCADAGDVRVRRYGLDGVGRCE